MATKSRLIQGGGVVLALAIVAALTLVLLGAAAAPFVLFGVRAHGHDRLIRAVVGGVTLSVVGAPLLLTLGAWRCGMRRRMVVATWGRSLLALPAAALAGYMFVTLLLLNYTPMILFALGGATICAALFAWGNLIIIRSTLTPDLTPDLMPSAAPLPPHEADRC